MSATREVLKWHDDFNRAISITSTNTEGGSGWTRFAGGTGTPTVASVDGSSTGEIAITLANDNASQYGGMAQNDIKSHDIDKLHSVQFIAKVANVDAVSTIVFGMAGDVNATPDSVAQNAWFRLEGSASTSAIVVETDDGTTDNDDVATGTTLASTYKRCTIDFSNGTNDVRFYVDGERVASGTTFDMSGYTGSLQPYVQVVKASGTGTASITIDDVEIIYKR